ncbi:STAS domain-containing protein [Amycolatopsis sp. Hca4]|uniref:STAS domain-containing protein n=1 Tax=unclassified Amycolatopsis TaxID=2618356 RepID=UPI001591ABB6|nr:STAS domain-containing protein [Amycolatopsis sp. Hca4]QKV80275.1 STAS domain-containing protein [Amycolatopsis sp. Hca4]
MPSHENASAGSSADDSLVVARRHIDGVTVLTVTGEVDLLTVADFTAALGSVPPGPLALDLTGVTFLDSSGINAILRASGKVEAAGDRLLVIADIADETDTVGRPLRLSGADELLTFAPSVTAALARLR